MAEEEGQALTEHCFALFTIPKKTFSKPSASWEAGLQTKRLLNCPKNSRK